MTSTIPPKRVTHWYGSLFLQVVAGLVLGFLLGQLLPHYAVAHKI